MRSKIFETAHRAVSIGRLGRERGKSDRSQGGRMATRRLLLIVAAALMLSLAATPPAVARGPTPRSPAVPGSQTATSCTQSALATALAVGGSITFNCGPGPHNILLDTPLVVTTTAVIDGAGQITVSGPNSTTLLLIPF